MECPVRQSLLRRHLVLGADRELVVSLVFLSLIITLVSDFDLIVIGSTALFAGGALLGLRALARADAWYIPILRRSIRQPDYVPARACEKGMTTRY